MSLHCVCLEKQTSSTSEMVYKKLNYKTIITQQKTNQFAYAGHSRKKKLYSKLYTSKIYIYSTNLYLYKTIMKIIIYLKANVQI